MDKQKERTSDRWQELATQGPREVATLNWTQAVERLEAANLKLQKARQGLQVARETLEELPRSYLPELNLSAFTYPTLSELQNGDLGSTYFYIGSILSIPNPWRYRAQALQTRLSYVIALTELETQRRELHVQLYKLFSKADRLSRRQTEQAALARLGQTEGGRVLRLQAVTQQNGIDAEWLKIEDEMSELTADYSHRWHPVGDASLPRLDYAKHPPALDGRGHFAGLQILRTSLQLVALEAQEEGLKLSSMPQLSILISAPPIYQSNSGNSSYLSLGDLRVSPYLSYTTDFRGQRAAARRQLKQRGALTRQELDGVMQATLARLRDGAALLHSLAEKRDRLNSAQTTLRDAKSFQAAAGLQEQIEELDSQIDDLNLSFWILDTLRWDTTAISSPYLPSS